MKVMSEIRYRLAKPSDAKEIADVHWHVRDRYDKGIFLSLGKGFLKSYYKITLDDPWEVIICAINEDDKIVGFTEATLDSERKFRNIKKHRFLLGCSALRAVLFHPSLFSAVWQRYRSLGNNGQKFLKTDGVRVGYWCWLKSDDSLKSTELGLVNYRILRDLGVKEYFFEIDKFNKAVYKYNLKILKAEPIEEITLPDGRVRVMMKMKVL